MTRITPFDLVFHDLVAELDALAAAAARAGKDPRDRAAFTAVPEVQRLLERLAPPAAPDGPGTTDEYAALLYAAFRFRDAGERVLAVSRARLEPRLALRPPAQAPRIPAGACYLQLPPSWFWARATDDAAHEPLDGCFVVAGSRGDEITIVAVLGLRRERGGFTQITLHVAPGDFVEARAVRRDPPFAPLMEGGATARFHSLATPAELLTLVHLALAASGE
jgi:hypothetical protein